MPYKPVEFTAGHLYSRCLLLPTYDDEETLWQLVFPKLFSALSSIQYVTLTAHLIS